MRFRRFGHWLVTLARPAAAVVTFRGAMPVVTRGRAPAGWLHDCAAIGAEFGITRGSIEVVRTWRGLQLRFSPDVPTACHQRLRNVFATYLPDPGRPPRGW